jgi:hypothetical protein
MAIRVGPSNTDGRQASPFERLKLAPPRSRRGAGQLLNVPGGDPAAKKRTAMQLVDGHDASREIHTRTAQLIGASGGRGKLDQASHVAQWMAARDDVVRHGPHGSGRLTSVGLSDGLAEVDGRFGDALANHLTAMRDALQARASDFPLIPALGSGSLPPPDRAQQLLVVRSRVKDDLDQLTEMAALAMNSSDRPLADELCSIVRSNTSTAHSAWYQNPAATRAVAIQDALTEWFSTPRTRAGEANVALGDLQSATVTALGNELKRPDAGERLPILAANGVFRWLMPPDDNSDAAGRWDELASLAAAPSDVMALDAGGGRLVALDAEAPGPVQWGGLDRGSIAT